jgi:AhpD family alkylhydroperoxidase
MQTGFPKKIFTPRLMLSDIGFLVTQLPQLVSAYRKPRLNRAFVEKIMTVTTAVNGCVYCAWLHSRLAVDSGISKHEVCDLFRLQFRTSASDYEIPALLYAQHFAESNRNPAPQMTRELITYYGEGTGHHIILFIRMIFFGNLFGNTWDAVLSRFRGNPAPNSSRAFEALFFLLTFWFMLPVTLVVKLIPRPDASS